MRIGIYLLLAGTALTSQAVAEDYHVASRMDAVTVYPQGADVTRLARIEIKPGDHALYLENLPGSIDPQSIRVAGEAGEGVEISSVDSKATPVLTEDVDQQRRSIEKEIASLADERSALDQAVTDSETQRQFLLSLANKQLTPTNTAQTVVGIDGAALGGLLDTMALKLQQLSKTTQEARVRQRVIDEETVELQTKISSLAPTQTIRTDVTVHFVSKVTTEGVFKITYRVNEAAWQPYYDARLTTPSLGKAARVEMVRRAEIMQSTAESWDNVALTLSTARPGGATSAPDIFEEELRGRTDLLEKRTKSEVDNGSYAGADAVAQSELPASAPAEPAKAKLDELRQRQAFVELAGFQANYVINGRETVDNSGQSKKVRISSSLTEVEMAAVTVPKLDARAYLTASFVVGPKEGAMLPGSVFLYRDGIYVGQGAVPMLNSGENAKLGFGVDDFITVKRAETNRHSGEEGLITSSNVEERAWDITVKNLHDFALPITVLDRVPFATQDGVVVTDIIHMTQASERDVDKKRGVLAWRFDLDLKGEKTIRTGYKVTWPKSMYIGMLD